MPRPEGVDGFEHLARTQAMYDEGDLVIVQTHESLPARRGKVAWRRWELGNSTWAYSVDLDEGHSTMAIEAWVKPVPKDPWKSKRGRVRLDHIDVECPYTSCGAKKGSPCINAVNGKVLEHGHRERARAVPWLCNVCLEPLWGAHPNTLYCESCRG